MTTNFKFSHFQDSGWGPSMRFRSKFENDYNFLILFHSSTKALVNQVYIRIWSFLLTFTVFNWMKKNSKISQFSSFLLRSGFAILDKFWISQKLQSSFPFIKKTLVNHVYIGVRSSWLPFAVLQWMTANFKISQFSRFLLRSGYAI